MATILVKRLNEQARMPAYMSVGAAGCDICAAVETPMELAPGARAAVPTGLALEIPNGFEVQVRPRSGLALKQGLTVLNAPGTIDSDYRGEVKVILVNLSRETVRIESGDRIAQLVVNRVEQAELVEADTLSGTERGAAGFGSTGVRRSEPTGLPNPM